MPANANRTTYRYNPLSSFFRGVSQPIERAVGVHGKLLERSERLQEWKWIKKDDHPAIWIKNVCTVYWNGERCRAHVYDPMLKDWHYIGEAYTEGDGWLAHIEVDERYQGQGIATAMIRMLIRFVPDFKVPYWGNARDHGELYLTPHGKLFIDRMVAKGILDREIHCNHVVPLEDMLRRSPSPS